MNQVGPYEILGELGAGGMGVVYRARREDGATDVALKVIAAGADASVEALARFQREVRIARELDHPGIVKVLDSGQDGNVTWFAMELVEGGPLSSQILEREFTWREAVRLVRETADAVAVAHARGVLHRDLKPGNILLDRDGVPHVTDFGLAKDTRTESKYTRTGQTLGTPAYMPPEQARGELAELSPASDVWALGCVLYEAIAGRCAFEGPTAAAVVGQVLTCEPPALRALIPAIPAGVSRLVHACLAKDPAARPPDAGALRDDCDRVLAGQPPVHGTAVGSRRTALVTGGGVLVVAAAAVVAWWPGDDRQGESGPPPNAQPHSAADVPSEAERLASRAWAGRTTDPEAALEGLERALRLEPGRAEWQVQVGLLQWSLGRIAEARAIWAHVSDRSPHWSSARLYRGLSWCFELKDWQFQATTGAEDLRLAADGSGPAAELAAIALSVIADRDYDGARRKLRGRRGWAAALLRAQVESSAPDGDAAVAVREWDAVLAEGIRFSWLYYYRGIRLERFGDHDGAIEQYTRALEMRPDYQFALTNRGAIRVRQRALAEGVADLERSVELDPDDHLGWEWLGIGRLQLGKLQPALAALHQAVRTKPDCTIARLQRASAWAELGNLDKAESDLTAVLRREPGRLDALRSRVRIREARGNWRGQLEDLDSILSIEPNDVGMRAARGIVRLEHGQGALAAAEDFEVCVAANPKSAPDLFNLGVAYLFAKEPGKALPRLEAAAAIHRAYLEANPDGEDSA
ncbi:MAG: protein kinase domain-containing protein, partial [Planctomycetota bacterium]